MRFSSLCVGTTACAGFSSAIFASILFPLCSPFSFRGLPGRQLSINGQTFAPRISSAAPPSMKSQVLDFIEPTTGVPVKLIGSMHYNPASIKLAISEIDALAAEDKLGSIIIESCDIRWNATLENELVRSALMSEMRAAYDLGLKYKRPVVLGDQKIDIIVDQLKNGAKEAVGDLLQPWNGGWGRLAESILVARKKAVPLGDNYLGVNSFLDPDLLLAAPASLVKYPLSYLVKSPVWGLVALTLLVVLGGGEASDAYVSESGSASDILLSLLVSFLETVIFARVFLKELLAERNEVLAKNILEQCRNYEAKGGSSGWNIFVPNREEEDRATGSIYAAGSVSGKPEEGKTVVAVLGLAHCNGIKKILTE